MGVGAPVLMLLGPVLLPWYVTWALPLVWLLPRVPRLVLLGTAVALGVSQWTAEPARFPGAYDANVLFGHYVITPLVIALLGWLLLDGWRRCAGACRWRTSRRYPPPPATARRPSGRRCRRAVARAVRGRRDEHERRDPERRRDGGRRRRVEPAHRPSRTRRRR